MGKVLEIIQVSKMYKNHRGIRDINMDIYAGDIFGFFGPNGAGKTTLLKVITGLIRADQGKIRLFGYDPLEHYELAMKRVGCMIESADSYEYMSANQNLQLAAAYYPTITKKRIEETLEMVGLHKFQKEKVKGFSSGMKQRLGLAAALLSAPELVILDEPTNGLDIEGMVDFRNLIKSLAAEHNITFLISSHMIHEMELMCNRIGILFNGTLVKEGLVSELLTDQQSLEAYYLSQLQQEREEKEVYA